MNHAPERGDVCCAHWPNRVYRNAKGHVYTSADSVSHHLISMIFHGDAMMLGAGFVPDKVWGWWVRKEPKPDTDKTELFRKMLDDYVDKIVASKARAVVWDELAEELAELRDSVIDLYCEATADAKEAVREALSVVDEAYTATGFFKVAETSEQRMRLQKLINC